MSADVPGRMTRAMCSAVLVFEAILLWLAIAVMVNVLDVPMTSAFAIGGGLGLAGIVITGMLGRPWGYAAGHALQVAFVLVGVVWSSLLAISVLFAGLWVTAYVMGVRIDRARAIR